MENSSDEYNCSTQNNIPTTIINNLSATKRPRPPLKLINITPIRLSDIQKELDELDKTKTPPTIKINSNFNNNNNNENSLSPIDEDMESFERDFDLLSFNSPKNNENEQPTKIQCTINVKDIIQTPCTNLLNRRPILNRPKLPPPSDIHFLNSCKRDDFKKLIVNGIKYLILKQLGKGGSSEVFLCFNAQMKILRAIKCVSLKNPSVAQDFIQEVQILKQLQGCDRIIKLYDFEIKNDEQMLLIVLETGGADLSTVLKDLSKTSSHLPKYKLMYYWMEILYAVKQIHQHGIIHADLKPANFLNTEDGLKLIDFGISTCIQDDVTSVYKTVAEGSLSYISPEALNNQECNIVYSPSKRNGKYKISFKSDVWSLGCILYQLVYKQTPYQHINNMYRRIGTICDPEYKITYPEVDWVPVKIIETIKKCLQHNMKSRPSVDELIADYEDNL